MTDRTTKVTLTANVSNYIANMTAAAKSSGGVVDTLAKQKAASIAAAEAQTAAAKKIGTAFLAIGAVAAVGVALAVKEFADFDAKMSQVQTLSHATAGDLSSLTTAALNAGQKIGFSATQVADAEIEMVKAGISVKDILGGALPGALQLAAAGQIDVADATEIATIAMTQFGLKGKDIPHVADLLTAGADKALGGVQDLGEALKSGGLVAAQFGVSLDETVGTLSAFANAGLIGETAGTDLRQMLLKLANPAADAAGDMKNLGISVYNAGGQFVGISNLAGQLKDKLGALSPETRNAALATIFGSRAIAGANVLYKEGAKGIAGWTKAVNDSGFAQQQATGKMDNLQGDLKKLQAAFQTDIIESGSGANDTLRDLTKGLTGLVSGLGSLPAPAAEAALGIGAVVAVTSLIVGGTLKAVPAIAAARTELGLLGVSGKTAALGIGGVALGVTALVVLLAAAASANAEAAAQTAAYGDTLDTITGKITANTRAQVAQNFAIKNVSYGPLFQQYSVYDAAKKLGVGIDTVTDAALNNKDAIRELTPILKTHTSGMIDNSAAAKAAGLSESDYTKYVTILQLGLKSQTDSIKESTKAKKQEIEATQQTSSSQSDLTQKITDAGGAALASADDIKSLADDIANFGKTALDARSSARDLEAAIDDATASFKENGKTLDITTEAGRKNAEALDAVVSKANAASSAIINNGGSMADAQAKLDEGRSTIALLAKQFGLTQQQVQDYTDTIDDVPPVVATQATLGGVAQAQSELDSFYQTNDGRHIMSSFGANTKPAQDAIDALIKANDGKTLTLQVAASDFGSNNNALRLAKLFAANGGTGSGHASGHIIPGTPSLRDNMLVPMASGEGVLSVTAMSNPANRAAYDYMDAGGDMANWSKAPQTMYLQAPSSGGGSASSGPMKIEGTMDLGNGLTGYVKGIISSQVQGASAAAYGRK